MNGMAKAFVISRRSSWLWQLGVMALLLIVLYYSVLSDLVMRWWEDPDYSHGFLVPLVSAYFVWRERKKLTQLPVLPDRRGLLLLLAGVGVLILGNIGAVRFLERSSLIVVIAALILYLLGWGFLKQLLFPIGFLIFMIPLPSIIFDPVAFQLQLFAAKAATFCLQTMQIPALREGNLIYLTTSIMDVTEACSGIRSLVSLLALGTLFAYVTQKTNWKRAFLIVSTIPIAILTNAFRVTATGILADFFGEEMAQGFYHNFSGWLVFVFSFGLLLLIGLVLSRIPDLVAEARVSGALIPPQRMNDTRRLPFAISVLVLALALITFQSVSHGEPVLLRNELSNLPLVMDQWHGWEEGLDSKTVEVLGVTDYLLRQYVRENSPGDPSRPLGFYVAYYASQHQESYHSPKICLPGSGWEIVELERAPIRLISSAGKEETLRINKVIIQKGLDRQLVLYWYQDRGRIIASEYWAKMYLVWDAFTRNRTDGALVRISVPMNDGKSIDQAFEQGVEFAHQILPLLKEFIPS